MAMERWAWPDLCSIRVECWLLVVGLNSLGVEDNCCREVAGTKSLIPLAFELNSLF